MRKTRLTVPIVVLLLGVLATAAAQDLPFPWTAYPEMRKEVGRLFEEGKFADAAAILEKAVVAFPDHLRANTVNLAFMRVRLGELDKAVEALRLGLAKGTWYGTYDFFAEAWAPLKAHPGFAEVAAQSEARRAEAEKLVRPRLDVLIPPGAAPGARLPLFIALHGGGENVDAFKPHWTSPLLEQGFVVAYPQSSQLVAPDGFDWMQDVPRTLRELRVVYDGLLRDYPVDPGRVAVGGFSSGGAAALEVVLNDAFPVVAFVSLCPPKPPDFAVDRLAAAAARGVKGTLLTSERDGRLAAQREMAEAMRGAGLLLDFVVTPDLGHWYPDDLAARIDATLRSVVRLDRPAAEQPRSR